MKKKILGDFQTPLPLARQIISRLRSDGTGWTRVLEPTCGRGNFIEVVAELTPPPQEIIGVEIQESYGQQAASLNDKYGSAIRVLQTDIFSLNLSRDISWNSSGKLLVVGNPPWITNSEQGALGAINLPPKSNLKGFNGLDALTGKSNFDIAEFIWLKLIRELKNSDTTIALLCKTSVARNVVKYCYDSRIPISDARIYHINARKWFRAAVDACLFALTLDGQRGEYDIEVFDSLETRSPTSVVGFVDQNWVANKHDYHDLSFLDGRSPIEWRQGIKHDAASVMELECHDSVWQNKLGEIVEIESDYIFPLLKSSDLKPRPISRLTRGVIVTQKHIGGNTAVLQSEAPKLWEYLNRHAKILDSRKSSIYRDKPRFSIFGVGDYAFARHKVVVSGFHKQPLFVPVSPVDDKPVLCDDTCYLLPLNSALQAAVIAAALNHPTALRFINSLTFANAKRPITKSLLSVIDLETLINYIPLDELQSSIDRQAIKIPENRIRIYIPQSKPELMRALFPEEKLLL